MKIKLTWLIILLQTAIFNLALADIVGPIRSMPPNPVGHNSNVNSVAFSPDGRYALSGSLDKTMKLWEVNSGAEIRTFKGHSHWIYSVAFSPDGRYAISGSSDKTMKLWKVDSGAEIRTFKGHSEYVNSVAFSPDGRYVLSGSDDKTMKLWEVSSGAEIRTFDGHSSNVESVALSPDGHYALSGSDDKTMKLWKVSSGAEIRTFYGHSSNVESVAFSQDGNYALSGSKDYTMKLWEVSSGAEIRTFDGHSSNVNSVAFSPDGRYAISGSDDKTMKLWEVSKGAEIRTFYGHSDSVSSVVFSPDGRYALSGSKDYTMNLWEVSSGAKNSTMGYPHNINSIAISPNGRYALSGSRDYTMKLWEVESGAEIRTFKGHSSHVWSVAFSQDGRYALSGSKDYTMKLWNVESGAEIRTFYGHSYSLLSVSFSPDGRYALSVSDKTMKLWEVKSGVEIRTFKGHSGSVSSVAFSQDGRYALSGSKDYTMKLWEVESGAEIRIFKGHSSNVESVAFSPDSRYAISGSRDKTMKLWDVASGAEIRTFKGHRHWIYSVAFSPDGRNALSGSRDKAMKLWEVESGAEIRTFKGHSNWIYSVAFSPDGHYVFSGSVDRTLKVWNSGIQVNVSSPKILNKNAAIIIAGGGNHRENTLWETTESIANYTYKVLHKRGFLNENIYYLNPRSWADFNGDGLNDRIVDAPKPERPLKVKDIREALAWAKKRGKLDQPLYIFFIDHGGDTKFQLSKLNDMLATELKAILDDYQKATDNEVVLVIDACYSGILLKQIIAPKRYIISSTGEGLAYFDRENHKGFAYFFASGLLRGMSFFEAFEYSSIQQQKLLGNITRILVGSATKTNFKQEPQFEDGNNGDKLRKLFINGSFVTGDTTLAIESLTTSTTIAAGKTITLKAQIALAQGQVKKAWAVIIPPKINLVIDSNGTPLLAFPRILLSPNKKNPNFWQRNWQAAVYNGDYQIRFYAEDDQGNIASSDKELIITVNAGVNPPSEANVELLLTKTNYKPGEQFKAELIENLNWGYDLYAALILPDNNFIAIQNTNKAAAINKVKQWQGKRTQANKITLFDLTLPENLAKGEYCLYGILSPEKEAVLETVPLWVMKKQCFNIY